MAARLSGPVWVPDPVKAFVPAVVKESAGKLVTIAYTDDADPSDPTKVKFELEPSDSCLRVYPRVERRVGVSEMDQLKMLNMATVLDNVDVLFQLVQSPNPGEGMNTIYSSVGPVLIAMNPFQRLPLYGKVWMDAYHQAGTDPVALKKLGPHAYRTAEESFNNLERNRMQSIVICGESGAGKTYTNREQLKYLCEVARRKGGDLRGQVGADPAEITQANELLESFGNASTTRNDNSSRFGKLTSLHFTGDKELVVAGCGVKHYLLERSRVCGSPEEERNYHIFYQLLRSGQAEKYALQSDPEKYEYTKMGAKVAQPGIYSGDGKENDDKADFAEVISRMENAGFSEEMRDQMFEGLAAVLHLGNVKVSGSKTSAELDTGSALTEACKLLGIEKSALATALTTKVIKVEGKEIASGIGPEDAKAQLDSVSKLVYSSIFDTIVCEIDGALTQNMTVTKSMATIGMLDIFGFEDMASNGFEQMFINLTNERIQHLFNEIIFAREKAAYQEDGIMDLDFLVGPNNIKCVELFLGTGTKMPRNSGIVGYLSNQIKTGLDDDKIDGANFVSLLNRTYDRHEYFTVCTPMELNKVMKAKGVQKRGGAMAADYRECFFIKHYAGQIVYTVKDFVPKSRDSFPPHLGAVMRSSTKEHIKDYFPEEAEGKGTVGEKFATQLKELAEVLQAGETLFVRCIKSNQKKVAGLIDRVSVLEQLIRGGVIAALEMRAAGLPERMTHQQFLIEFGLLELKDTSGRTRIPTDSSCPPTGSSRLPMKSFRQKGNVDKKKCEKILLDILGQDAKDNNEYALGESKVFMKSHVITFLESVRKFRITFYARCVQKKLVMFRVRKIDRAWEEIIEAEKVAAAKGFGELTMVKDVIEKAKAHVDPVFKALVAARSKHGSSKENFGKVMDDMKPHAEAMKTCRTMSSDVSTTVNALVTRRTLVDNAFSQKVAKVAQAAQDFLRRIAQVEKDCEDCKEACTPEELASCQSVCKAAREGLLTLTKSTLPELKAKGAASVDLTVGLGTKGNIVELNDKWLKDVMNSDAFKIDQLLDESRACVEKAEANSGAVLKVRKAFMEAVAELSDKRDALVDRLETLNAPAKQCIAVGFDQITDIINAAVQADQRLSELEEDAKDADAFRESFAAFEAAVEEAVVAVEKGKEELKRREEELRRRRQLRSKLDQISEQIQAALKVTGTDLEQAGELVSAALKRLNGVLKDMAELRQHEDTDIEVWTEKISDLEEEKDRAIADFEAKLEEEREERRETFKKRAAMFGGTVAKSRTSTMTSTSAGSVADEDENDPEVIIRRAGLDEYASYIHDLDTALVGLKGSGVERSKVTGVWNKLMKSRYPIGGGSGFSPQKR